MFTDSTYYKSLIYIPKVAEIDTFEVDYIDTYEREILKQVLGTELYNLVVAAKADASGIYYDLINGKDYTVNCDGVDRIIHWNGLVNDEKISLLSDYVFTKYAEITRYAMTSEGVVIQGVENSTAISPTMKLVSVYNRCAGLVGKGGESILNETLYNFLYEHSDDYPTWTFRRPNIFGVNKYGI